MEANPSGLQPPLPIRPNLGLRESPNGRATTRDQRPQKGLGQDATRRSPSNAKAGDKIRLGLRSSSATASKPFISSREHRPGQQPGNRINRSPGHGNWSPSVEGSGIGREGRHFTVANVGNNGQIFLRPAVRRDYERYYRPPVTLPITPPSTAGMHTLTPKGTRSGELSESNHSPWNPTFMTDSPSPSEIPNSPSSVLNSPVTRRRRAVSESTAQDVTTGPEATDTDVLKVVISKPQNEARSKTAEDLDSKDRPFLQVAIPSWKLGTPRFTLKGTPLIRGSSYAPTEEMTSSHSSLFRPSLKEKTRHISHTETFSSRIASFLSSQSQSQCIPPSWLVPAGDIRSSPVARPTHLPSVTANSIIEPSIFDALTFKPECDHSSVVRYSPTTKAITAATPPRLVAEITSPSFLDYDLISDFFLTFRLFLNPIDLLRLLVARLQWAVSQGEESGMIVKVRTFVAIRHWILNYFVDDFVMDYPLRVTFCDLLNDFSVDLPISQPKNKVPIKIVGELKKCWRRVCAQYWDGPEFDAELGHHVPITPGGIAGYRDPGLTPSFSDFPKAPLSDDISIPMAGFHQEKSSPKNVSRVGPVDISSQYEARPTTPDERAIRLNRPPTSTMSIASLDVVSCSFPSKALRMGEPNVSMSFGAHPADPSSIYANTDPIASTPRAVTSRHKRPHTSHRRNNSLSDSLREHGNITDKPVQKKPDVQLIVPSGSLVRGNFLPPSRPFVNLDSIANKGPNRQTTIFQPQSKSATKGRKLAASAMSGQGMRKLVGSVRRALSTKGLGISHTHDSFIEIAPIGPRGATTNRLPGTAVVPQARRLSPGDIRYPFRIDTLGARIAEDFDQAVREDAAETKSASTRSLSENIADNVEYSAAHLDSSFELRPLSDAAMTTGSKSIVIVDGTAPPDQLLMTGALPLLDRTVDVFANGMSRLQKKNTTPPVTPPSNNVHSNTSRRSSTIPSQYMHGDSSTECNDPLPRLDISAIIDGAGGQAAPPTCGIEHETNSHSSFVGQSSGKQPSAYLNRRKRQLSSRHSRSRGSFSQWRRASFHSGLESQSTIKSFDGTTCSEGSIKSEIMPPPLRMLRRKPGGDLKGAVNTAQNEPLPIRRSHSIGSLTAYSDSLRSSYTRNTVRGSSEYVDIVNGDHAQNCGEVFSQGTVAGQASRHPLSLFSTHSSKPMMRPSFELEAQKLAQIPDDLDDDGGVESTLLKLEGKYERKTAQRAIEFLDIPDTDPGSSSAENLPSADFHQNEEEKKKHRHLRIGEEGAVDISPISEGHASDTHVEGHIPCHSQISSFLLEDSLENHNSVPLFSGELQNAAGHSRTHTDEWINQSILEGPDTPSEEMDVLLTNSSRCPSFEFINRTESLERAAGTVKSDEGHSFLDVDSDNDSELSSELSAEVIEESDCMPRPLTSNRVDGQYAASRTNEIVETHLHPNGDASASKLTLAQALSITPPEVAHASDVHGHQLWSQKPLPPTPVTTPTTAIPHQALGSPLNSFTPHQTARNATNIPRGPAEHSSVHLPFILAFDSDILAQQFTLIEKDALIEVDWKELIEMRWKNSHNDSRSWVDFLRNTDARGVEVVIARFNIMVKWAISEIVLTQELEERARCIIKLLHIAAHCRKYRNFATMSQITVALTSNEIGRLSKTWAMVPPTDMKTMSDLEALVSPTKNFYNLRAEMEGGGNAAVTGCIPFVGIYTHDLLFNSQRPSEIASSPSTPPLVNFERYRVTATIVKTLLRLLEASTYYKFQPIEGITERCLWMSALTDDEIRRKSESLE
ncbi:ras GEF [Xylaria nigripes]|nr:ras GEF [Xylaria nigripes]